MSLSFKHISAHIFTGTLLFASSYAFAQLTIIPTKNKCLETKYSLSKQGRVEQLYEKKYNEQGLLLNETNTFSNNTTGNYTEEFTYEYDAKGNNTKITYNHNHVVKNITLKNYGLTGKLTQETVSSGSTSNPLKKLMLSEFSAEQVFFDKDGVTETVREKTGYDKTGQVIVKEVASATGKLAFSDKYTYAGLGKVSRWVHFDAATNVITVTNYEYNLPGNLTKESTLRNDALYAETLYTYNTKGDLEKKTRLDGKNQTDYFFTFEYNDKGLLTKENYFYKNEILSLRTFDYDTNGNKIKEVSTHSNSNTTTVKEWEYICK